MKRWALSSLGVILAVLAVSQASATIHTVNVANFSFSPPNTVVQPGDTVRWVLVSGFHTTTSDVTSPKAWDSGNMSTVGQHFDVQFTMADGPGPFPYHCTIHFSTMKDTIFVAPPASCCIGQRGDVNGDGTLDITDLIFLVDYSFGSGPAPACPEEADVNGDGTVDITDLIYLVDYSFGTGPAPVACP